LDASKEIEEIYQELRKVVGV